MDRQLISEQDGFRRYAPEILDDGTDQPLVVRYCEEYDAESRRWEPFISYLSWAEAQAVLSAR